MKTRKINTVEEDVNPRWCVQRRQSRYLIYDSASLWINARSIHQPNRSNASRRKSCEMEIFGDTEGALRGASRADESAEGAGLRSVCRGRKVERTAFTFRWLLDPNVNSVRRRKRDKRT